MDDTEKKFLGIDEKSFLSDANSKINGLDFQLTRIFSGPPMPRGVSPVHDVDHYVVLLRRVYREIEKQSRIDSRVANLKGKYGELVKRIKIRDHFEHGFDFETLPAVNPISNPHLQIGSGVKIATSLIGQTIISGSFAWKLPEDHVEFKKMFDEYVRLFPFVKMNSGRPRQVKKSLAKDLKNP